MASDNTTIEEEVVHVRLGDEGLPATAARRFIEQKYGKDAVEISNVEAIKGTGGLQEWLVRFVLDHEKARA
jgi:hypothetical protein